MPLLGLGRRHFNNPAAKAFLKTAGRMVPFRYLAGITGREVFPVKLGGSRFRYEFSGNDSIGEQLFWHGSGFFEPEAAAVFSRYLSTARTVLDIGANTGLYSLMALASNPGCRVVAWEPFPGNFVKLARNIALNNFQDRAELRPEAAAASNATAYLEPHENWTMHSVSAAPSASSIPVCSTTVDSIVPTGSPVDLIKIDVEGHEFEVLCGARRVLAECRPAILIEIQPGCPTRDQTVAFFASMNYAITPVDERADWLALPAGR